MASYIPGITDTSQSYQTPAYQPNYEFLSSQLDKSNQQYSQGLQKVGSDYASILNAPVTDEGNRVQKAKYIQDIQSGLKKVSTTDLSLPSNVAQAENLYAPFWKDTTMLQDIAYTKENQNQQQIVNSWKTSNDKDIRAQYDPIQEQYLQNSIEPLRTANRDPKVYAGLQRATATPFRNVTNYLDTEANKENLVIKWTKDKGPILIEGENGPKSQKNFATWAKSKLDGSWNEQFRQIGSVNKEYRVKQNMQLGMNREDAVKRVGEDLYNKATETYQENLTHYDDNVQAIQVQLDRIKADATNNPGGRLTTNQQKDYSDLLDERDSTNGAIKNTLSDYTDLQKPDTKQNFINGSENIIADNYKQGLINSWATGKSEITSSKEVVNQAYWNKANYDIALSNNKLGWANNKEEKRWHDLEIDYKYAALTKDYRIAGLDANGNKTSANQSGELLGNAVNELAKVDPATVYFNRQDKIKEDIYSSMYGPQGISSALKGLGVSATDQAVFNTYMNDLANGNKPNDPKFAPIMNNIVQKLRAQQINIPDWGADWDKMGINIRKGLLDYIPKYVAKNVYTDGANLSILSSKINDDLAIHNANEQKRLEKVVSTLANEPQYKNLTVLRHGVPDIIKPEDIAHKFPAIKVLDKHDNIVTLTPEMLSKAYLNGNFKDNSSGIPGNTNTVDFNGETYQVMPVYDPHSFKNYHDALNDIKDEYGSSEAIKAKYDKLIQATIPDAQFYKDQTGKAGVVVNYGFDEKKGAPGLGLVAEAVQPSNVSNVYDSNGQPIDPLEGQASLRALAGSPEGIKKYFDTPKFTNFGGPNGKAVVELTVKPSDDDLVKNFSGQTFYYEISPNATGEFMKSLYHKNTGNYIHGELTMGQPLTATDVDKAAGFDYEIVPDKTRNPSGATTIVKRQVLDPKTGIATWKPVAEYYKSFSDATPDDMYNAIQQFRYGHLSSNKENHKTYTAQNATGPTPDELEQSRKQQ